ncbi:carboxylesterase [Mycolicibacterium neoaurum]|uniref:alpha/beta hydrolase n=1 Tax=Mycolicibacterium neoaurum TaxID=1795 RepID=UPI0007435414|nr:alpha/beta hydrolase [Mycolicibacterium neoaurum]KUM10013.1 carboxylesterase [Mycolicibacterium neoaurum]
MSVLSTPLIADTLARLFSRVVKPSPKQAVRFADIPARVSTVAIPTRHGDTEADIYRPEGDPDGVYVNIHGGGFVVGHREQDDPWCRFLATRANVVVVNPDYLLAPDHRFPVAVEQLYDVVTWAGADERGWPGGRLCVGGQSAGGNLSASVCRLSLVHGGPPIALQVLHYAPLDLVTATGHKRSPRGGQAIMKPWMGEVFDTAYIPDRQRRRDPLASPAWGDNADEIAGIAPALVIACEYDRLRDEAAEYAKSLDAVAALVDYVEVPDVDHGYNIMSDAADVTRGMYELIAGRVRDAVS